MADGLVTEDLIAAAFRDAGCLTLTAKQAAPLFGWDVKTLRRMTEEGVVPAHRRGSLPAYTEGDVRSYLGEAGRFVACPSISPKKARIGTTTSNIREIDFTAPRTSKRSARRKP